jgi:hypothetical protein
MEYSRITVDSISALVSHTLNVDLIAVVVLSTDLTGNRRYDMRAVVVVDIWSQNDYVAPLSWKGR